MDNSFDFEKNLHDDLILDNTSSNRRKTTNDSSAHKSQSSASLLRKSSVIKPADFKGMFTEESNEHQI